MSWWEGGHFQRDPLPQLLCLLAALQVLENIIKLHHAHGSQAEGASGAADGIHKVIVVSWSEMDQPMMDVLDGNRERPLRHLLTILLLVKLRRLSSHGNSSHDSVTHQWSQDSQLWQRRVPQKQQCCILHPSTPKGSTPSEHQNAARSISVCPVCHEHWIGL